MNVAVLRLQSCFPEPMRQKAPPCRPLPPPGRLDCKKKSKRQPSPPRKPGGKPPPRPPLQANSKASPKASQPEEKGFARPLRFLAMEEVRILKRGEELKPQTVPPVAPCATVPIRSVDAASAAAKSASCATVPIRSVDAASAAAKSAPCATVPIRSVDAASAAAKSAPSATVPIELGFFDFGGIYSGPGFFVSPSPSSLPFPSSLLKKPAFLP